MDRGAWRATVHGVAKSQTRLKQFSVRAHSDPHTHMHRRTCRGQMALRSEAQGMFSNMTLLSSNLLGEFPKEVSQLGTI